MHCQIGIVRSLTLYIRLIHSQNRYINGAGKKIHFIVVIHMCMLLSSCTTFIAENFIVYIYVMWIDSARCTIHFEYIDVGLMRGLHTNTN